MDIKRVVAVLLTLTCWLTFSSYAGSIRSQDYYPLESGYFWTYQNQSGYELTKTVQPGTTDIDGALTKLILHSDGHQEYLTSNMLGVRDYGFLLYGLSSITEISPPFSIMAGIVNLGDTSSSTRYVTLNLGTDGSYSMRLSMDTEVLGFETVTVPAGTFSALKLQVNQRIRVSSLDIDYPTETTYWLVKGLGPVKWEARSDGDWGVTELSRTNVPLRNLSISARASTTAVQRGQPFSYYLKLTNGAEGPVNDVVVKVQLPEGVRYTGASGSGWRCGASQQQVTCSKARMPQASVSPLGIFALAPINGDRGLAASFRVETKEADVDSDNNLAEAVFTPVAPRNSVLDVDGDGDADANDGVMIQRRLTGAQSRIYFFRDGVVPNDLHYETIDQSFRLSCRCIV